MTVEFTRDTARFEMVVITWNKDEVEKAWGRRVVIEGSNSDAPSSISLLGVVARREIDESVGVINFDGSRYMFFSQLSAPEDSIDLSWKDFDGGSEHDLGSVRAFILEDGRVFVREDKFNDLSYQVGFLLPAGDRALAEFDR